jgi:hypothetical protein
MASTADTQFRGYHTGLGGDWNGDNMPYIRTAANLGPLATVFNGYCLGEEEARGRVLIGAGSGIVGLSIGMLIMYLIMKMKNDTFR